MDDSLRAQIDSNLSHLDALIRRGRRLHDTLLADPTNKSAIEANRAWQQDCGVAINQLSGGSKAHWLARSFSEAFLLRSPDGRVIEDVVPSKIVERLVGVLDQAILSLSRMGDAQGASTSPETAPPPRRFEFVHSTELRPVLEQAFKDSRDALEQGNHGLAMITSCGILEAIVTDALEYKGVRALRVADNLPEGEIAEWSFEARLAVAQKAGLIQGGCSRLTPAARTYREHTDANGNPSSVVSELDARRASQVLHVVMRDLDPGR